MVAIRRTSAGKWRVYGRSPAGRQESKTFPTKREASIFLAQMKTATATRTYVSPHADRMPFGEHARQWMASWNTEATTSARDASVMRVHVLKQWESWPLAKIDHLAIQTWITGLSQRLSPATVGEFRRLISGVMRSAVRNRLIAYNPCEDSRVAKRRKQDHDDQVVARVTFRNKLLPAVPHRYRGSSRGRRRGPALG